MRHTPEQRHADAVAVGQQAQNTLTHPDPAWLLSAESQHIVEPAGQPGRPRRELGGHESSPITDRTGHAAQHGPKLARTQVVEDVRADHGVEPAARKRLPDVSPHAFHVPHTRALLPRPADRLFRDVEGHDTANAPCQMERHVPLCTRNLEDPAEAIGGNRIDDEPKALLVKGVAAIGPGIVRPRRIEAFEESPLEALAQAPADPEQDGCADPVQPARLRWHLAMIENLSVLAARPRPMGEWAK